VYADLRTGNNGYNKYEDEQKTLCLTTFKNGMTSVPYNCQMLIFYASVVLVMSLKIKEFGGILFRPEESVSLSIVRVESSLVALVCIPPVY